ncbi:Glycerol-3-phosphate dehydrogenase mitochondrial [Zalerion maritima]|uniref:Glycerol-3-phosphate dehydrogenase n=1 Tax=Zalerion maritima TaxID=339359 RepID=A0AAD5RQS2_9PEZI|nr:Glycerol-3-phosphate dehydrogenase mitochondrial [Zalerion maritima]
MPAFQRASGIFRRYILPGSFAVGTIYLGSVAWHYRPRDIPGSEPPVIPPPKFGADGTFKIPKFPKIKSRLEQVQDLKKHSASTDDLYDILVIGGGATGTGVALDAASRGLRVALVERDDFSSGTSSKSTKLVHGGVRYLEQAFWNRDYAQFQLVMEALRERTYFLRTAPHLTNWLPIMIPLDKWWKAPYYWCGTKAYDFLARGEGIESSYFLSRSKALENFPQLKRDSVIGALVYYDGAHNDSRMNVSLAVTAALYGATMANYVEVTDLVKDEQGAMRGVKVRDRVPLRDGKKPPEFDVRAKCVINCTGPFADELRKKDNPNAKRLVGAASGVHIILPGYYSPSDMGLIDPKTPDGRVCFFLPWQGNTVVGTTDRDDEVVRDPIPADQDIDWILKTVRKHIAPDIELRRGDILSAWCGLRPLVYNPNKPGTSDLLRTHFIETSDSGLVSLVGGKWTTYRQMAEDCVDTAIHHFGLETRRVDADGIRVSSLPSVDSEEMKPLDGSCQTHMVRLVGAHGFSQNLFINIIQHFGLETDVAKHLTESYGDRAWAVAALCKPTQARFPARGERLAPLYPFVDGEVRYSCRHEMAQTAVDVVARRTRLAFLNSSAALESLPRVIDLMAEELGWDSKRKDVEWKETVKYLESMGLPKPYLSATRKQVEQGKLDFKDSLEYKLYSRHDKPLEEEYVNVMMENIHTTKDIYKLQLWDEIGYGS